jgi:hypothetical protein
VRNGTDWCTRLEEAQEPDSLSTETIIDNMSTEEWKRLSKVRNIGIAVGFSARPDACGHVRSAARLMILS